MKKLFRCLLVVTMLLCMSLSAVSALGSISRPGSIISWDADDVDKEKYELVWNETPVEDVERIFFDVRTPMGKVNRGEIAIKDYLEQVGLKNDLPKNTKSVILVQEIRDLICRHKETKEQKDIFNVTVTWEVPNLVEGMGDIYVFHYSDAYNRYELIKPIKVDYANKTITAVFSDLCPIGVVAVKKSQKPVDTSAVNYGTMLAIIAMGAGALYILTNKKEA